MVEVGAQGCAVMFFHVRVYDDEAARVFAFANGEQRPVLRVEEVGGVDDFVFDGMLKRNFAGVHCFLEAIFESTAKSPGPNAKAQSR
jgi:hypothetical protein